MIRRLSPAGAAAVAVLLVERPVPPPLRLEDARGARLDWPGAGDVRHGLLRAGDLVDDVLVVGRDDAVELHVHGGPGVVAAVEAAAGGPADAGEPPEVPDGPRAARARASVLHGRLAALGRALAAGERSEAVLREARAVLARAPLARRLVRPPVVRLVGLPNAGKSTLFNALLLEDRALVSPREGTTRDTVTARCRLAGATIRLEDTRGRATPDPEAPGADLLVHLTSADGEAAPPGRARGGPPVLRVAGKADLRAGAGGPAVCGLTGAGLPALRARITAALGLAGGAGDDVLAPVDPALLEAVRALLSGRDLALRRGANGLEKVR